MTDFRYALRQLAKSFGGARALRGVDFDLLPGEVHALQIEIHSEIGRAHV